MNTRLDPDFTLEELMAFLQQHEGQPLDGYWTTKEWATMFGINPVRMLELLHRLKELAVLKTDRAYRDGVDGTSRPVQVYAITVPKIPNVGTEK